MNWNNIIKYSAVTIVIVLAVTFILTQNPTIKSLITWNSIKEVQTSKGLELPEKETEKQIDNLKQISVSIKDYNYYPNVIKLKKSTNDTKETIQKFSICKNLAMDGDIKIKIEESIIAR